METDDTYRQPNLQPHIDALISASRKCRQPRKSNHCKQELPANVDDLLLIWIYLANTFVHKIWQYQLVSMLAIVETDEARTTHNAYKLTSQ